MSRYLETADDLRKEVESFLSLHVAGMSTSVNEAAVVQLGHIVNLAVRCNPRQAQGTVRKNIVAAAMRKYCRVTMTKEVDEQTQRSYNKIHIVAREK